MTPSAALLGLCLALAVATEAAAYVRMTTQGGVPLRWTQSCLLLSPQDRSSVELPLGEVEAVLSRSMQSWNEAGAACSAISLLPRAPGPRRAAPDGIGALLLVTGNWGRGALAYDPSAAAVTTLAFQSRPGKPEDGTITDADIELNAVGFRFAVLDAATPAMAPPLLPGQRLADLENTITHELGHALGLGHSCWDRQTAKPPLGDDGQPAPDCNGPLPDGLRRATMFPYATDGETSKRALGGDDIRGLCGTYPKDEPLPPCEQTVYGGCSYGRAGTDFKKSELLLFALALVLVACRRAAGPLGAPVAPQGHS